MKKTVLFITLIIVLGSCKKDKDSDNNTSYTCASFQGIKLPVVLDSMNYYVDSTTFSSTLDGGKGVDWSFTGLLKQDSTTVYFKDTTGLKYSPHFPNAQYVSKHNNELVYLAEKSNKIVVQGAIITVSDTQFVAKYDQPFNHFDFPLEYGEDLTNNYVFKDTKVELVIEIDNVPQSADSLQISRAGKITKSVDGCGTIKTPTGTYEVLRVYREEIIADTAIAYVFIGFGTKSFTIIEQETTIRSYEFVSDSLKTPVVIVDLDDNKQAKAVRYLK